MKTKHYLAIAERVPGEVNWSITFPQFPGVTSVAERFADVIRQAKDTLATAVEDMAQEGEALSPSIEEISKRTGLSCSALLSGGARVVIATEVNS